MSTHVETEDSVELPHAAVIIATYNYGHWIIEAIASVILQDYKKKSIIIVDDGSTDETQSYIEQLLDSKFTPAVSPQFPSATGFIHGIIQGVHISYLKTENGGPSRARNLGLKYAIQQGAKIFAILDADDYWLQGKLSKSVLKILEAPESIGAVYTDNLTLNIDNGQLSREFREAFDYNRLLSHNMIHSGCVINGIVIEKVGGYDETLRVAEDYDLWLRIGEQYMIYHLPEPLVTIRAGNHNTSSSVKSEVWQKCWKRVYEKVQERHAKHNRN
jgi:glycosyltransferase involved in cell wall biosynthesis